MQPLIGNGLFLLLQHATAFTSSTIVTKSIIACLDAHLLTVSYTRDILQFLLVYAESEKTEQAIKIIALAAHDVKTLGSTAAIKTLIKRTYFTSAAQRGQTWKSLAVVLYNRQRLPSSSR